MKKITLFVILLVLALGCGEIELPTVGPLEVGFINNTNTELAWGISFTSATRYVSSRKTSVLPYSENGYWIKALDLEYSGLITINPEPGETIEAYSKGVDIRAKIRY